MSRAETSCSFSEQFNFYYKINTIISRRILHSFEMIVDPIILILKDILLLDRFYCFMLLCRGLNPADCELGFLKIAKDLENFGVDLHIVEVRAMFCDIELVVTFVLT